MTRLLSIILFTLLVAETANAQPTLTEEIEGLYYNEHLVRNMSIDCSDSDDNCGLEQVLDKVTIRHATEDTYSIKIELVGQNLHTCSVSGTGEWTDKNAIVMRLIPGEFDSGVCDVVLTRDHSGALNINSEPYKACDRYCGASAQLESYGLIKRK